MSQNEEITMTASNPDPTVPASLTTHAPVPSVAAHVDGPQAATPSPRDVVFDLKNLEVFYGHFRAVRDVTLTIRCNEITAFIGPSGCGKTTVLRCFNRLNDLIVGARVQGKLLYHDVDLYGPEVSPTVVR